MIGRILMVGAVAAALGACATETRTVVAEDVCSTYGFAVNSPEYRRCQSREADARRSGRMSAGTNQTQLVADARAACQSYGIAPYTERYERCVRNEVAYRAPG